MSVRRPKRAAPLVFTPPCLALATRVPSSGTEWVHEIKLDGYRVQALVEGDRVRLLTRNGLDWSARFGRVARDFAALGVDSAIIDCEAVVLDERGRSNFSALQSELKKGPAARILMMAFDLLHLDGRDVAALPLIERKTLLSGLIGNSVLPEGLLGYTAHVTGDGREILAKACSMGLEGIISKRVDLPYRSGRRGDWTKSKCSMADPFVVIGYVLSAPSEALVGSLVLAYHHEGRLVYAGRVGTGFSVEEARAMAQGLAAIASRPPPLSRSLTRDQRAGVRWVAPKLVAQIEYRDVTADLVVRHASFQHFREDKRPEEIVRPPSFDRSVA